MIISYIENPQFIYFNLHAEEVISSNYLNDDNQGIYIKSLQCETVNRLQNFINDSKFTSQNNIVLDFDHIEHLQPNILKRIVEIRDLKFKLTFLNVSENIIDSLSLENIENNRNILNQNHGYDVFYFFTGSESNIYEIELNSSKIFYEDFKKRLKKENEYITEYKKPHASSFVYLNSFIDLKKFMSNERPFIYYSLYRLAIKITEKWQPELNNKPILVGQSLTSTFIVSILSKLIKLDILVFDKIGPITKLYKKLEKHNFENRKYIVVSDLVCLGTEVKITKSLIEFSGGKYLGNVSLVKVETLTREHLPFTNRDRTISVFSIRDNNNKELKYFIYTNLKPLDE